MGSSNGPGAGRLLAPARVGEDGLEGARDRVGVPGVDVYRGNCETEPLECEKGLLRTRTTPTSSSSESELSADEGDGR